MKVLAISITVSLSVMLGGVVLHTTYYLSVDNTCSRYSARHVQLRVQARYEWLHALSGCSSCWVGLGTIS
eukprot:6213969-Pleurochrysis_carterae.AAC.2